MAGLIPKSGKYSGAGLGNPLQYSCLGKSVDRGAWQVSPGVAESDMTETIYATEGHCGCIHVLAIMNKAAVNIPVQFLCGHKYSTECGPLEKGMANHFGILALRTP